MNDQPTVNFNPDDHDYLRPGGKRRGMVGLVMRLSGGRIQTENAANYFLLGFALVVFIVSLAIFFSS